MINTFKSIQEGKGLREASRLHNVPGPPTVLTKDEELLAVYIADMAEMGFGLTKDILCLAFRIVNKSGRQHPFTDGLTGQAWFEG